MNNLAVTALLILILLGVTSCAEKNEKSYIEVFDEYDTQLIQKTKSFQAYEPFDSIRGHIKLVSFKSDSLELNGLLNTKNINPAMRKPVLVYLHGGFALGYNQLDVLKPFTDAGYVVFAPTYRGENGNPGYFELFFGEVKDAKASIHWISKQPYIDPNQIFVFGWSVGGGISLNLSFHNDLPIKLSGSSAGIYDHDLIKSWATEDDMIVFPYDYKDKMENYLRLPIYSLDNMVRPHYTYIGEEDDYDFAKELIDSIYPQQNIKLNLIKVKGDHVSSLSIAINKFIKEMED